LSSNDRCAQKGVRLHISASHRWADELALAFPIQLIGSPSNFFFAGLLVIRSFAAPVILTQWLVLLIAKVKRYNLVVLAGSFDSLKELGAKLMNRGR
jgi:hypothetical protein